MGIRFYCPNGHKLNVKQFQAGRRGICPYCGERTVIPTTSTRVSTREERKRKRAAQGLSASNSSLKLKTIARAPTAENLPETLHDDSAFATMHRTAQTSGNATAGGTSVPLAHAAPPAAIARSGVHSLPAGMAPSGDPIAEAGESLWYVRPTTGGQFGPASGDVMRTWLAENRINHDSLVWREGWPDWQEAGDVFAQLKPQHEEFDPELQAVINVTNKSASLPYAHEPLSKEARTILMGFIATVVILLCLFLFYVLAKQIVNSTESNVSSLPQECAATSFLT